MDDPYTACIHRQSRYILFPAKSMGSKIMWVLFDVQGALRVSRFNPFEGWVASESVGQDILISGRVDMNR